MPDDDDLADKYLLADERLAAAGFAWYEVSNWAARPAARCRHNVALLDRRPTGGASGRARTRHVGGVRWWNVKHPAAYAGRLAAGAQPGRTRRETLDAETRRVERVLLETPAARRAAGPRARRRRPGRGRSPPGGPGPGRARAAERLVLTLRGPAAGRRAWCATCCPDAILGCWSRSTGRRGATSISRPGERCIDHHP